MASRQLRDGGVRRIYGQIIYHFARPFAGWQPVEPAFLSPARNVNPDTDMVPTDWPWVSTDGYDQEAE